MSENPLKDVLGPIVGDILATAFEREKQKVMVDGGWVDFLMGAASAMHAIDVHKFGGDKDSMRTVPPAMIMGPSLGRQDSAMEYVAHIQAKGPEHWLYEHIPPGDHSWLLKKDES